MLAEERFARIVEKVNASGTVTVAQLACELGISESTVRRDLDKLDSLNKLTKVHGGAVCLEDAHVSYDLTLCSSALNCMRTKNSCWRATPRRWWGRMTAYTWTLAQPPRCWSIALWRRERST